jgi:hypothetical protein
MENKGFSHLTSEYRKKEHTELRMCSRRHNFCPSLSTDNALLFEFQYCRMQALSTEFENLSTTRWSKYRCTGSSNTCWFTFEMHTLTALPARCSCSHYYSFLNWPVNRSVVVAEVDCDVRLTRTDIIDISRDTDEEKNSRSEIYWFVVYLTALSVSYSL